MGNITIDYKTGQSVLQRYNPFNKKKHLEPEVQTGKNCKRYVPVLNGISNQSGVSNNFRTGARKVRR